MIAKNVGDSPWLINAFFFQFSHITVILDSTKFKKLLHQYSTKLSQVEHIRTRPGLVFGVHELKRSPVLQIWCFGYAAKIFQSLRAKIMD